MEQKLVILMIKKEISRPKRCQRYTTKFEYDNMNRITKVVDALNRKQK